jgi:hypothetical protein
MEGSCSTGQSPQWAVVPVEEEEEVYSFLGSGLMVVFKRLARLLHIRTVLISNPSYPDLRFS